MKQLLLSTGLVTLLLSGAAQAGGPVDTPTPAPISASDLASMSGGANQSNIAISSQNLAAVNSGNQVNADSLVTGNVTLASGAFNGFNGIGNFVFNTGNNNNVQGTLSVTILTPAK